MDTPSLTLADYVPGHVAPLPSVPTLDLTANLSRRSAIVRAVHAHELAGMTGALVVPADPSAPMRRVVNLAWLMRHRGDVVHPAAGVAFYVATWRYGQARPAGTFGYSPVDGRAHPGPLPVETFSPVLLATMADGRTFATSWADPGALHGWLDRPSFRGYLVDWSTRARGLDVVAVGGLEYRSADYVQAVTHPHQHPSRDIPTTTAA